MRPFDWEKGDKKEVRPAMVRFPVPRRWRNMVEKPISPVFLVVKVKKACCPRCREILHGNNSHNIPWYCKCGTWEFLAEDKYKIV